MAERECRIRESVALQPGDISVEIYFEDWINMFVKLVCLIQKC